MFQDGFYSLEMLCCSLFKVQARYIVERMDSDLWNKVLVEENQFRRQLIDQVHKTDHALFLHLVSLSLQASLIVYVLHGDHFEKRPGSVAALAAFGVLSYVMWSIVLKCPCLPSDLT